MTERDATFAAIDKAFQEHIGKLFAVLCAAAAEDIKSGLAIERFTAGLKKARDLREAALQAAS